MAARSRSSSISVAERTLVAISALSVVVAGACKRRAPDDAQAAPLPSASASQALPAPAAASSKPLSEARKYRLGERAEAVDYALRVSEVERCKDAPLAPRKGHVRLGVKLEITGKTERAVPANPFYAKLFDRERDGYAWSASVGGCEPALKSAHVARGQSVTGWVSFELPERASGLELSYSPYVRGGPEQPLTFVLGR